MWTRGRVQKTKFTLGYDSFLFDVFLMTCAYGCSLPLLLSGLPLPLLCDLRQVAGRGDKQVLRRLARRVGLTRCASLQKRAIQFGTRIANKNVSGEALLGGGVRLEDIVHPP